MAGIGYVMIFKAGNYGPKGKPYMYIGVDKFLSCHLYLGVADKPEALWNIKNMGEVTKNFSAISRIRGIVFIYIIRDLIWVKESY
jgi:hypothetical protein